MRWIWDDCWSACLIAVAGSHNSAAPVGCCVVSGWAKESSNVIRSPVFVCSFFSVTAHVAAVNVVCCYALKAVFAQCLFEYAVMVM